MWDLVLGTAPSTAFGLLVAILAPYMGKHIHEVTTKRAALGGVVINVGYQTACGQKVGQKQKPKPCGEGPSWGKREGIHRMAGEHVCRSTL